MQGRIQTRANGQSQTCRQPPIGFRWASSIGLTPKTCILLGCARVSTADQNLALQRDILTEAGCPKLLTEHVSGEGDTLVVWKLDRLAAIQPAFEAALTGNFVIYPGRASDLSSGQE